MLFRSVGNAHLDRRVQPFCRRCTRLRRLRFLVSFWASIRGRRSRRIGVVGLFPFAEVQANLGPLLALLDPGEHMEELEFGILAVLPVHLEHLDHLPAKQKKRMSAEVE